jgi:hypothetical protein
MNFKVFMFNTEYKNARIEIFMKLDDEHTGEENEKFFWKGIPEKQKE